MLGLNQWQSIFFSNHPKADETLGNLAYQSRHDIYSNAHQDLLVREALLGDRIVMIKPSVEPPSRSFAEKWVGEGMHNIKRKQCYITDADEDMNPNVTDYGAKKQKSLQFDKISHQIGGSIEDPSSISAVLNESARESFSLSPDSQLFANSRIFTGVENKFLIPSPSLKFLSSKSPKIDAVSNSIKAEINLATSTSVEGTSNALPLKIIQTKPLSDSGNMDMNKDINPIAPPKVCNVIIKTLLLCNLYNFFYVILL